MGNKKNQRNNIIFRTIILIVIIFVLNLIFFNFYWHFDLTKNRIYSLSPVTKNILKNLDDQITIKVYFSKDLPTNLVLVRTELKDLLSDFNNYSNGKIKISFEDPEKDEDSTKKMRMLGIPKLQFNTVTKDEYSVTEGYLGLALFFEDRKEVLPVVENTHNLEYDLVRIIKQLESGQKDNVYFVIGQGEYTLDDNLQYFKKVLEKQYNVDSFDLSSASSIPHNINTLIIVNPQDDFSERDLYILDQFIMQGGSLLVFDEGVKIDDKLMAHNSQKDRFFNFLEYYGIKINKNLVLDSSHAMAPFSSGFITFNVPYPFWPKIKQSSFNSDSVMVNKLESLVLAWTSSISFNNSNKNTKIVSLVNSSPKSWLQEKDYNLDPNAKYDFKTLSLKSYPLAGFISGQLDSYFKDKDKDFLKDININNFKDTSQNVRIVVVADSDFIKDSFLRAYPENLVFAQNIVDGLSQDADLINIRSREVTNRPIKVMSESQKNIWKYFNIFIPAILVIIYGVTRSFLRKKNSFEDELI